MKITKRITILLAIFIISLILSVATFASNDVNVYIDNNIIDFPDARPFINQDNRTMVPISFISRALGAEVDWDGILRIAYINYGDKNISIGIGNSYIILNGQKIVIDTKAIIKEDRTFVPVSFISRALGAEVDWDGQKRIVYIIKSKQNNVEYSVNSIGDNVLDDGKSFYFINPRDMRSIYVKTNGVNRKLTKEDSVVQIQSLGDYIIFVYYDRGANEYKFAKINKETKNSSLYTGIPYRLQVSENYIYYADNKGTNTNPIYKMSLNGLKELIINECDDFVVMDNNIYYTANGYIYKDNNSIPIYNNNNNKPVFLSSFKNNIYFTSLNGNTLYSISNDGKLINSYKMANNILGYVVLENEIYYTDNKTGLYKYDINSKKETKILSGVLEVPNFINGNIYTLSRSDKNIYIYNINSKQTNKIN